MSVEKTKKYVEKLNTNKTPATLFVGVGGIGSEIVTRVAERCKGDETRNIRFVAMDTNANDLRGVKNSKANIVPIQTSSTQSVLDYLKNDNDARNNWFPNNTTLYPKTVSEGAGQVRAISRLALNATIKTGEISKLYKAIDTLFLKDDDDTKQALRVVVVSSAAGGTGSGIAMTIGMLVRQYLHKNYREKSAIVRGFLLLPGVMDTVIPTEVERESLRRNGFATIKEINAFMIKASGFCGVRKDLERYKDLYIEVPTTSGKTERLENLPFDFCFLLDRVAQSEESMQTLEQYKEFAAQSLYEQNIGPMQRNAFSMEDNIIKEFANGDNLGRNRFGGIGAAVLRYPYEDIIDYIAYGRAIEKIGDGETVGNWLKYDQKFKETMAEYNKNRATTTEAKPEIEDVYVSEVDNDEQEFGNSVKAYLASDIGNLQAEVTNKLNLFIKSYKAEILSAFTSLPEVFSEDTKVNGLKNKKNYEENEEERGQATENLSSLRKYEAIVKRRAATVAKGRARSILINAPKIEGEVKPYHLESLLKTTKGCMHPNAARYMLYALKKQMKTELEKTIKPKISKAAEALIVYASNADKPEYFDVKGSFSKEAEKCFDDVCNLEKDPSFFDKMGGYKNLWDALNKHFMAYSGRVIAYRDLILNQAAYEVAVEYLERLCAEFEKFYNGFSSKVVDLKKQKEDIVDKLRFRKGDTVYYVCGKEDHLNKIAKIASFGSGDLALPDDLSAEIFESVKNNAEFERLSKVEVDTNVKKEDIFDKVLIDYFRKAVRENSDEVINLSIIKAISIEQKFEEEIKLNKTRPDDEEPIPANISDDAKIEYLKERIKFGNRLAAAGVACANFNEPRIIQVCTYNEELGKLRDVDIKKTIETLSYSAVASDTVSKYDMRFFNALYNVTPDKLVRFKSPEECEDDALYSEDPGIYYRAYHEYIKKIGPDSTKSATISLHIDKRWDSLTEMPEVSMDANYKDMLKIHSALVYGIVHGMIKTKRLSQYDENRRNYVLEDSEGDTTALVVSNNTECDEFYEVLDALYRDRASVARIYEMVEERCELDVQRNCKYDNTEFLKDVKTFKIGDGHAPETSLFEIPLVYYNSLPRTKLDDNELSIMIDSVINVIETEVNRYEQECDRKPRFAERLEYQFNLLVENFNNDAYDVDGAMRKNTTIQENPVIAIVCKKICNKIKALNVSKFAERNEKMRKLIKPEEK